MNIYTGFLLSLLLGVCAGAGESWDYKSQGSDWPTNYATCGKTKQSPINIENGECDPALNKSITFTNYDNAGTKEFTLKNNGHSVVLSASSTGASITLKDVGTFDLLQVHFHWGSDNTKGSEHTLMGKAFPAEMHMVHQNKKYSTFDEAKKNAGGLAVLGFFLKEDAKENGNFNSILNKLTSIVEPESNTTVSSFAMSEILAGNLDAFYRYQGSLTTPGCDEAVVWTVFKEPVKLSASQLAKFRMVKDSKNNTLVNNYREVQKLNGREVTFWDTEVDCSGAETIAASIFSLLLLSFFIFTLN